MWISHLPPPFPLSIKLLLLSPSHTTPILIAVLLFEKSCPNFFVYKDGGVGGDEEGVGGNLKMGARGIGERRKRMGEIRRDRPFLKFSGLPVT